MKSLRNIQPVKKIKHTQNWIKKKIASQHLATWRETNFDWSDSDAFDI